MILTKKTIVSFTKSVPGWISGPDAPLGASDEQLYPFMDEISVLEIFIDQKYVAEKTNGIMYTPSKGVFERHWVDQETAQEYVDLLTSDILPNSIFIENDYSISIVDI